MLGLVALTMAIIYLLPRITKAVPASLGAIVIVSLLAYWLNLDSKTVGDVASIAGGLPRFSIPMVPFDLDTLSIIFLTSNLSCNWSNRITFNIAIDRRSH